MKHRLLVAIDVDENDVLELEAALEEFRLKHQGIIENWDIAANHIQDDDD